MQSFGVEQKRSLKRMTPQILMLYFFWKQVAGGNCVLGSGVCLIPEKREIAI